MPAFNDLSGRKFNKLRVIERDGKNNNGQIMWKCQCECGNFTKASNTSLVTGHIKSCGCLKHVSRLKDLTGQKFNQLTVISFDSWYITPSTGKRHAKWKVRCDCGNTNVVLGASLVNRGIISCGCAHKTALIEVGKKKRIAPETHFWNNYRSKYTQSAKNRNYSWELTKEEVIQLARNNCAYCGVEPRKTNSARNAYLSASRGRDGYVDMDFADSKIFVANGIDRVDNTRGYTVENCVTCCNICNQAKNDLTADEWNDWVDRLVTFRKNSNAK